jgi:hypothetical protein
MLTSYEASKLRLREGSKYPIYSSNLQKHNTQCNDEEKKEEGKGRDGEKSKKQQH